MKEHFKVTAPPATPEAIEAVVRALGPLPSAYVMFLHETNGAEFGSTDRDGDCLVLWGCEELAPYNESSELRESLPNCLAIGSDGGDGAVLLVRTGGAPDLWPVVRVGFGSLDPDELTEQAPTFATWAESRFRLLR